MKIEIETPERTVIVTIEKLANLPNLGSERGVSVLMSGAMAVAEAEARSTEWCCNIGLLFGAGAHDLVGDLLDGTEARAEWDMGGMKAGLFRACVITVLPARLASQLMVEGLTRGQELAREHVLSIRKVGA